MTGADAAREAGAAPIRPVLLAPPRRDLDAAVEIYGAGRVTRALLTVAALRGETRTFRVWCRHEARAELLRVHLADLPPLAVEIAVSPQPPKGGQGPLVLAAGLRTSRRSRQSRKDQLYADNIAMIDGLMPWLAGRAVIVVTNPCTQVARDLIARGVAAFGIGVMNDQLRFELGGAADVRLAGAHNPFELGFGMLGDAAADGLAFSRAQYRELANAQDRARPALDPDGLVARTLPAVHESAWRDLFRLNESLDAARRWYARQRIASRYLENGIACGRAILMTADFLSGKPIERPDLTLETGFDLGDGPAVLGWPLDAASGEPRALRFGPSFDETRGLLRERYGLDERAGSGQRRLLRAAAGLTIACDGQALDPILADAVPLIAIENAAIAADLLVSVSDDPVVLAARAGPSSGPAEQIAQHRGKNPFEHRDVVVEPLAGGRRLARFSVSGATALIDDAARQVALAVPQGSGRRDELRKLLRDQILVPAYAARGAWVLHAGLIELEGHALLLLGGSGAGKTTGALHALHGERGFYGASERVLVWPEQGRLMALGVPESLTVFPGSLRGLSAFDALVADRPREADWRRDAKLRLTRDDVVSRLAAPQMPAAAAVDRLVLLAYDPGLPSAAAQDLVLSQEARLAVLRENDLTREDEVRARWLGWFTPRPDPEVARLIADRALPAMQVCWREPRALGQALREVSK